jgi:hypothetical protein
MLAQWLDYRLDSIGFELWEGQGIFLSSESFRMTLGPTQFSIQWVPSIFPGASGSPWCRPLAPFCAKLKNEWSYTATPPYAFMTWTDTTAPLLHLLIFIKRLNETFCNFTHWQLYFCTTAILLHHSYTAAPQLYFCTTAVLFGEIFLFSHLECIQDFLTLLEYDKCFIFILIHNINLFLIPDISSINSFWRTHVT